ncbi:MAG: NAD(P)H-dependent oxidoreductase subunit E [Clostridiales bacterium]|mgnify:FL=1|jgi:NADH-quinone oxidoreductase, E subunit|nr:NAD(P)H-dependent oxidoreductase subunit E [Clostridiales bacterium]
MGNTCDCGCDEKLVKLQEIIEENKDKQGSLIHVLHEAQLIYGYLPIEVQKVIAEGMKIPLAEVYGVVTFYAQFSLKPKGEYKISVCLGTACYVKGADLVLDKLKESLDIQVGDCTEDGKFSLDACRCIGACGLAPVITINNDVYGRLVPEDVPGILAKY